MAQVTQGSTAANGAQTAANNMAADSSNPPVNRKKQKRRQKQAARMAAEQQLSSSLGEEITYGENGHASYSNVGHIHKPPRSHNAHDDFEYGDPDFDDPEQYEPAEGEDLYYTDDEGRIYRNPYIAGQSSANGHPPNGFISTGNTDQRPKKKKAKARSLPQHEATGDALRGSSTIPPSTLQVPPPPPPPPPLSNAALRSAHSISRDRIWNTSTAEERERIKEFWLSLGEEDRRSLVKVEKEAVLRKMKEQQKHSCSCTVCGRKRTAIEEELEVLYDAYYEELEQYANHTQTRLDDGTPIMPPPRMYGHPMARMPPDRIPPLMNAQHPSRGRIQELADEDDEGDDEEYSEEDDDGEEYSDDEPQEELRGPAADFFNFGNSLTVQGGILTVADDLLKNDGKKFIEMMEQLAERRMQREEEAQYAAAGLGHRSIHGGPNHGPPPDEEEYDDEEDEYDSQEDEEYEEDEMDTMTEEQRMEEGRRMFQIFAARMFEQRVLTAYREKVARERQQKLIEELEEESRLDVQREAKKAKEAQKKKDKKKVQKQAKEEEKAKREAEKAAEEAAARAVEEKKLEEQRQRREEQRKKREAEKKAQDEERSRKEAEKLRRLQEEREKHAEQERRQREQKEREKKKREEAKRIEREEREAKEKEAKEKKESEERERREREAKAKAEKDAKERAMKEEAVAQQAAQAAKRAPQSSSAPIAPGLHAPIGFQSPHLHIATPVIPKAPTPVRPRQASQQESHASSPMTPHFAPGVSSATSPSNAAQFASAPTITGSTVNLVTQKPSLHHPQPVSALPPMSGPSAMPPHSMSGFVNAPPAMMNGFPSSHAPMIPGIPHRAPIPHDVPMYSNQPGPIGSHYRGYPPPNNMPFPPGMNGMRAMPQGRGTQMDGAPSMPYHGVAPVAPPKISTQYHMPRDTMPTHSHSRQQSASIEAPNFEHQIQTSASQTQPIARPAPIQRPASVAPHQRGDDVPPTSKADIDDLSNHLGSSALLDDTDVPLSSDVPENRRGSAAPGAARHGRLGFGASPLFTDSIGSSKMENFSLGGQSGSGSTWATPQMPFGTPVMASGHTWSAAPGAGWSTNNAFGVIGGPNRPNSSRPVTIRLMISQACKQLTANSPAKTSNGFHSVTTVLRQVEQLKPINEAPVQIQEMLDICDTEGNAQNGGGSFTIRDEGPRGIFVRFDTDDNTQLSGRGPGEIGSPIQGNSTPAFRPFHPPGGIVAPSGF